MLRTLDFYAEYNEMPLEGFKEMAVRTSLHVRKITCADWTGSGDEEARWKVLPVIQAGKDEELN